MATHNCTNCGRTFSVPDWLDTRITCPQCMHEVSTANATAQATRPAPVSSKPATTSAPAATSAPAPVKQAATTAATTTVRPATSSIASSASSAPTNTSQSNKSTGWWIAVVAGSLILVFSATGVVWYLNDGNTAANGTRPNATSAGVGENAPQPTSAEIRIRFVRAEIAEPVDFNERQLQGLETPDPYVVAFLNGRSIFVCPVDAVGQDTYTPEWNVIMPDYFTYDFAARDEFSVVVFDSDTDILGTTSAMFANSRIEAGVAGNYVGVSGITEQTFNEDDRLGRWSGRIPTSLLTTPDDEVWEISAGRIRRPRFFRSGLARYGNQVSQVHGTSAKDGQRWQRCSTANKSFG